MKMLTKYILSEYGGKALTREEIEKICKKFGKSADKTINFMISYGYIIRILRGLYYVKTIEEFKMKKSISTLKILSLGMNKIDIEWYFGLTTALRLNGVTHEFSPVIYVLSDKIYRPKVIKVNNEDVKFIKLKRELFGFGVIKRHNLLYSDVEKTLLDTVYLSKYRSVPEKRIISILKEYENVVKKKKIREYMLFYPKSIESVIKNAGLI